LYDIWADPDYDSAQNKPERLLMAALDYSVQKLVVYVAPEATAIIFVRSIAFEPPDFCMCRLGRCRPPG